MKFMMSLFCLLVTQATPAQKKTNWGFMNGVMHLKKGDSLVCLVEKQVAYGKTLLYKLSDQGSVEEIPLSELNYFVANNKTFKAVPLYNSFEIMELVDTGKITLYTFNEIKYQAPQRNPSTGNKTIKGDILIHYVIDKAGMIQEIKDTSFKLVLKQIFSDCGRMGGKVTRGDYLFEDMPQIIKDYNHCKGLYCTHSLPAAED